MFKNPPLRRKLSITLLEVKFINFCLYCSGSRHSEEALENRPIPPPSTDDLCVEYGNVCLLSGSLTIIAL